MILPTFIHLSSRKVHVAGITPHPNEAWMIQVARNVTMEEWGFLAATLKFEVKSIGSRAIATTVCLFPQAAVLPQTLRVLLNDG
jgi:hypothetical protein